MTDPWQFLLMFREKITVHDRGKDFPNWSARWYATFADTDTQSQSCTRGSYGNGKTPAAAIRDIFLAFNQEFKEGRSIRVGNFGVIRDFTPFRIPSKEEVRVEFSLD